MFVWGYWPKCAGHRSIEVASLNKEVAACKKNIVKKEENREKKKYEHKADVELLEERAKENDLECEEVIKQKKGK